MCMQTQSKNKVYGSRYTAIAAQCTHTGMFSCATNSAGAGLVTPGRVVQVSHIEVAEPKVPQQPHTTKRDEDVS